jgi:signal transduction histidine kinase
MVSTLAPNKQLLQSYLALMLGPIIYVNLYSISGMSGNALAAFFGGFLVLLLMEGRLQNDTYWKGTRNLAQLQAMIEATPGTLTWVSSDLKYLGLNKRLADLLRMDPGEFVGKEVGFAGASGDFIKAFTSNLFQSSTDNATTEINSQFGNEKRTYYIVAQKYNMGTEAVMVGLDVTRYKQSQQEVARQKSQILYSSKLASLGEIVDNVEAELKVPIQGLTSEIAILKSMSVRPEILDRMEKHIHALQHVENGLRHFTVGSNLEDQITDQLEEVITDALALCSERFKQKGIELRTDPIDPTLKTARISREIFSVLINLLNNAFDAVEKYPEKWVRVTHKLLSSNRIEISIIDSGKGIPKEIREKIFEPLYTTKAMGKSTGVGLTVAREIVESCGGTLQIDANAPNTSFVMTIPLS